MTSVLEACGANFPHSPIDVWVENNQGDPENEPPVRNENFKFLNEASSVFCGHIAHLNTANMNVDYYTISTQIKKICGVLSSPLKYMSGVY